MVKVAVLGAGVIGLCTGINIQQTIPSAQVTVVADKFNEETVSNGAVGIARLNLGDFPREKWDVVKTWIRESWNFYRSLASSPLSEESGSCFVNSVIGYNSPQEENYSLMKELGFGFHKIANSELEKMGLAGAYKYVYSYTTIVNQPWKFLPWLLKRFKDAGGLVWEKKVNHITELAADYDIVANCCGLRSGEVTGDYSSYPIKGHLVHVHAPWFKYHFYGEGDVYVMPHDDKVIIGATREKGVSDLTPDPETRARLLAQVETLFPQLKGAKVIGDWCGLRPGRSFVRLEAELMDCGGQRKLPVVHNYGHSGYGITLAWGCGKEVAQHVKNFIQNLSPKL